MSVRIVTLVLAASFLSSTIAAAANPFDDYALEAANRMGLLEHCGTLGFATAQDVQNARKVLYNRPDMPPEKDWRAAEDEGKRGVLLAAGEHVPLPNLAGSSHRSIQQMCEGFVASASVAASMAGEP
jgi:hypothetical protein